MSFNQHLLFFGLCTGVIVFAFIVVLYRAVSFRAKRQMPPPVTFVDKPHSKQETYREFAIHGTL